MSKRAIRKKEPAPFDTMGIWSVVLPCGTRIVGEGESYLVVRPSGDMQALIGTERLMHFGASFNEARKLVK